MTALVICINCNTQFSKKIKSIKKSNKNNTAHTCSKKCAGEYGALKRHKNSNGFGFYHRTCSTSARLKKLEYNLTPKYIEKLFNKQKGLCALTKIPMVMNHHKLTKDKKTPYYASVDRLDNAKGYIKGNIQFLCLGINYMRNTFSIELTEKFINSIKLKE